MLYYLTGVATERSAVLAYNMLYDGVLELGEDGVARTAIGQIKRQEPGHYAFYQMSAREHWARLAGWQKWLVRKMRAISFAPVGAYNPEQSADFGEVMSSLGITDDVEDFTQQIARVERELLLRPARRAHRAAVRDADVPRGGRAGPGPGRVGCRVSRAARARRSRRCRRRSPAAGRRAASRG